MNYKGCDMEFSSLSSIVKESPTFALLKRVKKMKSEGIDILPLVTGEPDFATPKEVVDAAYTAMKAGHTKYTIIAGIPALREAICGKLMTDNELHFDSNEIIVSNGVKQSLFHSLQAILQAGDEVILLAPYWVTYIDVIKAFGATPKIIYCDEADNYKCTADKLHQAINSKTKAIIINSPTNPTGLLYTEDELLSLGKVLLEHKKVWIFSDEIYELLLFDHNKKFVNLLNLFPEFADRFILFNGMSKCYAMTGWRVGYIACHNKELIRIVNALQSMSTSSVCTISQYAALRALELPKQSIANMVNIFYERFQYAFNQLNAIPGVNCINADGTFYLFCDVRNLIEELYNQGMVSQPTAVDFCNYVLEKHFVAIMPGTAFGFDGFVRLSIACDFSTLKNAIERIKQIRR